jgi:hypothetical protein
MCACELKGFSTFKIKFSFANLASIFMLPEVTGSSFLWKVMALSMFSGIKNTTSSFLSMLEHEIIEVNARKENKNLDFKLILHRQLTPP